MGNRVLYDTDGIPVMMYEPGHVVESALDLARRLVVALPNNRTVTAELDAAIESEGAGAVLVLGEALAVMTTCVLEPTLFRLGELGVDADEQAAIFAEHVAARYRTDARREGA